MNEYLAKFRAQYPDYDDMSDTELAKALHGKFYADMSFPEFAEKIGLDPKAEAADAALARVAESGGPVRDFLHQAAEGATFGQADKIVGAGAAAANALFPAAFPGSYRESQQKFQQRTDDLQAVAPGASVASMAAGAVPGLYGAGRVGLGPAVSAIRGVGGSRAMTALRGFTRNPVVRASSPVAAWETWQALKRLF